LSFSPPETAVSKHREGFDQMPAGIFSFTLLALVLSKIKKEAFLNGYRKYNSI